VAVTVLLPSLLATEAGGRKRFDVAAGTIEEALKQLPVRDLLFDERGELRPLVNVYVDGRDMRAGDGVATRLGGAETIRVVAAIAGGAPRRV
jgi:molybdopterin converting factor small subunit